MYKRKPRTLTQRKQLFHIRTFRRSFSVSFDEKYLKAMRRRRSIRVSRGSYLKYPIPFPSRITGFLFVRVIAIRPPGHRQKFFIHIKCTYISKEIRPKKDKTLVKGVENEIHAIRIIKLLVSTKNQLVGKFDFFFTSPSKPLDEIHTTPWITKGYEKACN